MNLAHSEADAERLYYLAECQRRVNDDDERLETVKRLAKDYRQSAWRLKALVSAGNHYLLQNRSDMFEALYKAAYEDFPDDPMAPYCHWKVTWSAYVHRRQDSASLLREQLERYPADPRTGAALYFLGRLSEADRRFCRRARLLRQDRAASIRISITPCARANGLPTPSSWPPSPPRKWFSI